MWDASADVAKHSPPGPQTCAAASKGFGDTVLSGWRLGGRVRLGLSDNDSAPGVGVQTAVERRPADL